MNIAAYFELSRDRPGHVTKEEAMDALAHEVERRVQTNGRMRVWGYVESLDCYVRVILADGGKTLYNAFMDTTYTKRRGKP